MLRISLINMPFTAIEMPSIALTQLRSVVEQRCGSQVAVDICYVSNHFARYLGLDLYRQICEEGSGSCVGDWLFRQTAFPELPDNTLLYRQRYFPARDQRQVFFEEAAAKRPGFDRLLDEMIASYRLDEADLVGFTSMFSQNAACFALARKLKERRPDQIIAIGGANCESPMGEEILRNVPAFDYVFAGPGLLSFPRLVEACLTGDRSPLENVAGVFTRRHAREGIPAGLPVIGEETDINQEVPLDYEGFLRDFQETYAGLPVEPLLFFETSRGCWWGERAHCTFCGLNGGTMSYRSMSAELAHKTLTGLFRDYYPRVRLFNCVDNIMPKSYPRELFGRLEVPPDASLFYEVKADLTDEDLELLARAHVDVVQPGIEALSTSTLKLMRKGTTSVRNVQFLKSCMLHDVQPAWNLLIGFPGEGQEVYRRYHEQMHLWVHLPPPSGAHMVRFDRFSPYFTQAKQYGLDLQPLDAYSLIYPFSPESLAHFAYYFADRNVMAPYFLDSARWIGKLRQAMALWRSAWAGGHPPVLHFAEEGGTAVYDTRSGPALIHEVGEVGRRILETLQKPATYDDLGQQLAAAGPQADLEAELAKLRARGLLFEDEKRLVSLVLPREAPMQRLVRHYSDTEAASA
jgi:magnesium-protoporphyrin IX monomethyl ester (oxidative) cyclase